MTPDPLLQIMALIGYTGKQVFNSSVQQGHIVKVEIKKAVPTSLRLLS